MIDGRIASPAYDNMQLAVEAVKLARESDLVIFVGGLNHNWRQDSEGYDRESYNLPYGQPELIRRILEVNSNVVLVLVSGNAVDLRFAEDVPSIVQAWYCGSESGHAIASVLSGDVNPSGKLPISFPATLEDCGAHAFGPETYPGVNETVTYSEDIYVGYRWFDSKNITPMYAFGHGLSYTIFDYGKAKVDKQNVRAGEGMTLTIPLKNTGKLDGDEVIQVYLRNPADKEGPIKTLRAFRRVSLPAGQTENIRIELPASTFECFNPSTNRMEILPGKYELLYGGTSDEKALQKLTITVKK